METFVSVFSYPYIKVFRKTAKSETLKSDHFFTLPECWLYVCDSFVKARNTNKYRVGSSPFIKK